MPSPFPGMDPYLEAGHLWHTVHTHLIVHICEDLQPQIVPRYVASSEERVLLGPLQDRIEPDAGVREPQMRRRGGTAVAVRPSATETTTPEEIVVPELDASQRFVTIRDARTHEIITAIEILSPWNKSNGYEDYRDKQREYLRSETNLVEIDLLRAGRHTIAVPEDRTGPSDYRVCIHRARAAKFGLIRIGLRARLPNLPIPLRRDDPEVVLHLGDVLDRVYDGGAYFYKVEYGESPEPPLSSGDADWADGLLREAGLRSG